MKLRIIALVLLLTTIGWVAPVDAQPRTDRPDFFEEGNEQLEREIQRLNQKPRSDILTIEGEPLQWQDFTLMAGHFTVSMPGVPTEESEVIETAVGRLEFKGVGANYQSSRFIVAYSDDPKTAQLENIPEILSHLRDAIAQQVDLELMSDEPISLDGYSGRELMFSSSSERVIFRLYLVQERLYILGASQDTQDPLSEDVIKFFDSFRLLPSEMMRQQ